MPAYLIFAGQLGSGKTLVSRSVAQALNRRWSSFGSTLKIIANERGIPISREHLQELGEELVARSSVDFCRRVLAEAKPVNEQPIIIDGLRHREIYVTLQRCVEPNRLICIFIEAPEALRMKRLMARDAVTEEAVLKLEKHSTEVQVKQEIRKLANYTLTNDKSIDDAVSNIAGWINRMGY